MKALIKKYKHAAMFLYAFIYIPWFIYLERTVISRYHVIHMELDDHIPFNEIFVIPYFLWFAYVGIVLFIFFFKNTKEFYRMCIYLFTGMTIFLIISTIFPNGHNLRPVYFQRDNILTDLVKILYRTDTSTNLFPSIHVYNSIGTHLAVINSDYFRERKWVKNASFVMMILICMSTVFIKQHSVFDVLTALLLSGIMYYAVYGYEVTQRRKEVNQELG